jgi:hypothetical protein
VDFNNHLTGELNLVDKIFESGCEKSVTDHELHFPVFQLALLFIRQRPLLYQHLFDNFTEILVDRVSTERNLESLINFKLRRKRCPESAE